MESHLFFVLKSNSLLFGIRYLSKQIEEAEEIAAINLAKFRKAQDDIISASSSNTSEVYQVVIILKLFLIKIDFHF